MYDLFWKEHQSQNKYIQHAGMSAWTYILRPCKRPVVLKRIFKVKEIFERNLCKQLETCLKMRRLAFLKTIYFSAALENILKKEKAQAWRTVWILMNKKKLDSFLEQSGKPIIFSSHDESIENLKLPSPLFDKNI